MKTFITAIKHQILILLISLPFATAMAAPGALSTAPLYLSTAVEPNIVFLTDDSGSMDWTMLTDRPLVNTYFGNVYSITSPTWTVMYLYTHPTSDNAYDSLYAGAWGTAGPNPLTAPTQETLNAALLAGKGYTDWDGIWRVRNSDYNKIYYNPAITYKPWVGVDDSTASYTQSTPTAARVDPYLSAGATVDLTTVWNYKSYIPDWNSGNLLEYNDKMYPAHYYTWTDTDVDGVVDAGDGHTLIGIIPATATYSDAGIDRSNRSDCANAAISQCSYAEEIQNFANWFTYYRRRILAAKNALSSVISSITSARIAYGTINNNNSDKIGIASMNADPASGNKKALLDKVFGSQGWNTTPLRQNLRDVGRYFACQSSNFFGASGTSCPILSAAAGGECQQNFAILMTDGAYNGSSPSLTSNDAADNNTDGDANTSFDGNSYADSYDNTLADVAMNYYERDLKGTLTDAVPTVPGVDDAEHQHMVTYTVGFGVTGTLDPFDTVTPGDATDTDPSDGAFAWPDPAAGDDEKIDDLWHAAYNGRGLYLNAYRPEELYDALTTSLADIVGRNSSAAAVAFNSTNLGTGSVVYLARFNSATWRGELLAHYLDPFTGAVNPIPSWNAADSLDSQTPTSRTIYTYNEDTLAGVPFKTLASLSAVQQNDMNMGPGGVADALGQDRIDFLRGNRSNEGTGLNFRIRSSALGDIVHANPVYVGKPLMRYPNEDPFGTTTDRYADFKGTTRDGVIYVGANDGMLHGFDEDTGDEVMAYAPGDLFSSNTNDGLHYLTDPGYTHRYYVDLSPSVADVFVKASPAGTTTWRTVLIGGMRGGGSGLFALDITNPTNFTDANADDIVMWEFTNSDDTDLGDTFSKPTIALTNAVDGSGNNRWAAIVGNGYNNAGNTAKLYVLFLDGGIDGVWTAGTDYIKIDTSAATGGLSSPAVVDTDMDGIADRVYAGDLAGNLWAFDLSSTTAGSWDVAYKQGSTPKAIFNTGGQPITTKPVVSKHPTEGTVTNNQPNLMVFFGTGQYLITSDKTNTSTQTMYGVWDDKPNASGLPYVVGDLTAQTLDGTSTASARVLTDNVVDYSSEKGWYFDLPINTSQPAERIVVNPKIRGDLIFYNTLIPNSTVCSFGGSGWLMVAKQVNGGRPDASVFDINNDGVVDTSDLISGNTASGQAFGEGLPAESNFLSDNQYTPGSTGNLEQGKVDTGGDLSEGRMSWREIIAE